MKQLVQLIKNNAQRAPTRIVAENEPETLFLYDVIDPYWGISASDFNKALAGYAGKKVTLRVNCPGGDVFEGRAMAAAIAQHGNVHAIIEGVAASAATFVTASCASITIAKGALYMIHNAWTMAYGNKSDLRQTADLLDTIDGTILDDYERLTGQSREQLAAWMDAETWFNADQAVEHGFAGSLTEATAAKNSWDLSAYNNAPKPAPQVEPEQWEALRQRNQNRLRLHELG
jgi:ATP-dependent protease ClpP protease subunit